MEKKNFQFNQIVILAVALILSVALVVISAVIISNKILSNSDNVNINSTENDLSMQKNIMIATDSQNESYSEVDEDSEEMQGVVRVQDNSVEEVKVSQKTAVEYMSYTAFQLLEEFNNVYTDYGYINGGYTIANNSVCPYFMFSVQADGNTILDKKMVAITVNPGGKVFDNIAVGMTFKEIKNVLGNKIVPAQQTEENCTVAYIEMPNYTVTFEFESAGGKSINAMILMKQE